MNNSYRRPNAETNEHLYHFHSHICDHVSIILHSCVKSYKIIINIIIIVYSVILF